VGKYLKVNAVKRASNRPLPDAGMQLTGQWPIPLFKFD
jgi:hypothetical protein